jgi:predicted CoA-binding protein
MNVAVVGASNKPERYSYQAVKMLVGHGHRPLPVHPSLVQVDDIPVHKSLAALPEPVHTVSLYLSAKNQGGLLDGVLASGAVRVIFNPGTENPDLEDALRASGVEALRACTLVLLRTGQFNP